MYISESFAQASCIAAKLAAGIIMVAAAHGALAGYSGDSGGMQKIAFSSKGNNATAAQSHAASACKIINQSRSAIDELISTAEQFGKVMRSSFNAIHNAFHCVGRRMASHRRDEHGRNFEMSEKFKEPKAPRFAMWPLITAGFASAVALGLFAITPAGGLFAPNRLDGTSARKLKQEISYCRMPEVSPHRLGRVLSGRAKPVAGSDARKAT